MPGMDDTLTSLEVFLQSLERFDDNLRSAAERMQQEQERVDPLWVDSFRQGFDQAYAEHRSILSTYLRQHSGPFHEFIASRIRFLQEYLRS